MLSADVRFLKGYRMIRSHIGSTQECGVVLKFESFFHLLGWSFGLGFPIKLEALLEILYLSHVEGFMVSPSTRFDIVQPPLPNMVV